MADNNVKPTPLPSPPEQEEDLGIFEPFDRYVANNLATNDKERVNYLKQKYPQYDFELDENTNQIFVVNPKTNESFDLKDELDKSSFGDYAYKGLDMLGEMGLQGLGGAGGALLGGPVGSGLGAAGGTLAAEGLRELLANSLGIERTDPEGRAINAGINAGIAGVLPSAFKFGGKGLSKLGEKIYKSAPTLQRLDRAATTANRLIDDTYLPSEMLWEQRTKGTSKKLVDSLIKQKEKAMQQLDNIVSTVDASELKTNYTPSMNRVLNEIKQMASNPNRPVGVEFAEKALNTNKSYLDPKYYLGLNKKPASTIVSEELVPYERAAFPGQKITKTIDIPAVKGASMGENITQKRDVYKTLIDSAFDNTNFSKEDRELGKLIGRALRKSSEETAEKFKPGLGYRVKDLNKRIGAVLNVEDVGMQEAKKTLAAKPLGAVSTVTFAVNPKLGLAKQLGNFLGSAGLGPTSMGVFTNKIGNIAQNNPYSLTPALMQFLKAKETQGFNDEDENK